jgi:hypothetical protein
MGKITAKLKDGDQNQRMSVRDGMLPCWLNPLADLLRLVALGLRSKTSLAAENLFLRKQLAFFFYKEETRANTHRTPD